MSRHPDETNPLKDPMERLEIIARRDPVVKMFLDIWKSGEMPLEKCLAGLACELALRLGSLQEASSAAVRQMHKEFFLKE